MGKAFRGYAAPFIGGVVILLTAASLRATPALMYTFAQAGFLDSAGQAFSVTGSFAGVPDAAGAIGLANLTAFSATVSPPIGVLSVGPFALANVINFSFETNLPSSTLNFQVQDAVMDSYCTGLSAAITPCNVLGVPGGGGNGDLYSVLFPPPFTATTFNLAVVTPVAMVPEPDFFPVFFLAMSIACLPRVRSRISRKARQGRKENFACFAPLREI